MKKRISELMDTISEMLSVLVELNEPTIEISDCLAAVNAIQQELDKEEVQPSKTLMMLKEVEEDLKIMFNDASLVNEEFIKGLYKKIIRLKLQFNNEVKAKLNVLFMPYKASMWDSFATVYQEFIKDDRCEVNVVPIPYYQLSNEESIPTYEGGSFPENIPITHYSQYKLEEQLPDIVFVHNIYDNYNSLTRVYDEYYTWNLKKYTDMLVFIPYHVSSFIPPKDGGAFLAYGTPSVKYVDKIILVGDFLVEDAIRRGIPKEKLLVLGSPKLDSMINTIKENTEYPIEWKEKINEKTVYLVNTGCLFFADQPFLALEWLIDAFNIPRIDENSIVIWRPHPLTKVSIMKYRPYFLNYYLNLTENQIKGESALYNGIILDETEDYLPALKAADILISTDGSLLRSFLLTEKKVLYWGESLPKEALLPQKSFYYAFNRNEPWFELIKKFSRGYDPLAENRKGLAAKVYANTDGTSGKKIHKTIKECVLGNLNEELN